MPDSMQLSDGEDEPVDLKEALFSDPIVGTEQTLHDQHGPGAIEPRPLPSPPGFTPSQWATHCITHLPYHPGCTI